MDFLFSGGELLLNYFTKCSLQVVYTHKDENTMQHNNTVLAPLASVLIEGLFLF